MNLKLRLIGLLISPTPASLLISAGFMVLLGASTLIKYGLNTNSIYNLVLGTGSSEQLISDTHLVFSLLYQNIFGNPTLNKILFFVFWMLVGLVVYLFIQVSGHGISEADETLHELNYVHTKKSQYLEHLVKRTAVQIGIVVLIALYSTLFLKALLPYSLLSLQISLASLPNLPALGFGLLAIIVLGISLHIYVILLRLLLLRIRVFGID